MLPTDDPGAKLWVAFKSLVRSMGEELGLRKVARVGLGREDVG